MKKTIKLFLSFLLLVLLMFSGCSLLPDIEIPGSQDDELRIKSFEFILDEQLQFKNNYGEEYFGLDLFCGEKYQIKTNVDDELGSDYYFKYYTDDETYGMFTISENGLIETNNERIIFKN